MFLAALAFALSAPACASRTAEPPASACSDAAAHLRELRSNQVNADPTLRQYPELAQAHLQQTLHVFTAPLAKRCADDPEVAVCVMASTSIQQASACVGG